LTAQADLYVAAIVTVMFLAGGVLMILYGRERSQARKRGKVHPALRNVGFLPCSPASRPIASQKTVAETDDAAEILNHSQSVLHKGISQSPREDLLI